MNADELASRIIANATDYVGMVETSNNAKWSDPKRSEKLLGYMKRVKWWAPGAAYCAAFDGAVVIESLEEGKIDPKAFQAWWTAHCMTNVRNAQKAGILRRTPAKGAICLCQNGAKDTGHAWIVTDFTRVSQSTIEGNTMSGKGGNQRQGDGIYCRVRNNLRNGNLVVQGYIHPADILAMCGSGKAATNFEPATPREVKSKMLPVYGMLAERGMESRVKEAIAAIPGAKYDPATQLTMAPESAVLAWIEVHRK